MVMTRTLLIAEDEPGMRMAIQDALEPLENFDVVEAVDGCEALQLIDAGHQEGLLNSVKFYGDCLANLMWDGAFSAPMENKRLDVTP